MPIIDAEQIERMRQQIRGMFDPERLVRDWAYVIARTKGGAAIHRRQRRTRIFSARIVGNGFGKRAVTRAMMREKLRQADAYDRAWVDSHIKSASDIRREDAAAYRMFDSLPPSAEVVGPWDSGPIRDILDKQ